jgi:endo-1,4-beta-xylanase
MVERLGRAIRDGKAQPMIVVLINGLAGETMYCDTRDGKWPLESVIVKDLIPHIDATYRTIDKREARGIEGFSMGGFGAAHFGFKYPDRFGVVSILAPALLGPDIEGDTLRRKWSNLFSAALGSDLTYFEANNPFDLALKNAGQLRGRSIIRIVPHDTPEHWLIPRCEKLHALLNEHGIDSDLIVCAEVDRHNYGALYDKLGESGIGFFANAFPKDENFSVTKEREQ